MIGPAWQKLPHMPRMYFHIRCGRCWNLEVPDGSIVDLVRDLSTDVFEISIGRLGLSTDLRHGSPTNKTKKENYSELSRRRDYEN
jgi:hypothetical protein